MANPMQELTARLDELGSDLRFVDFAARLRPRLSSAIDWNGNGDVISLARQFMDEKQSRPEAINAVLLVRALAAFERYLRKLLVATVETSAESCAQYDDLPESIRRRNLVLSGELLSSLDSPKDHWTFSFEEVISNLATCKPGATSFRLNGVAFASGVFGSSPDAVEKALKLIQLENWWDDVGADARIQKLLGTKGHRATGTRAKERLRELSRWRNHIAHAGDEDIALSHQEVSDAIVFIGLLAAAIDGEVEKRYSKRKK